MTAWLLPALSYLLLAVGLIVPADPWNPPHVAACETIEDLNPGGPTFDMVDWLTPDADIRTGSHLSSEPANYRGGPAPYVLFTKVTYDRIVSLKNADGDTWDVCVIDDIGVWSWRTETAWGMPRSPTQFRRMNQILLAPRVGRGGYPGMRWVNCDSSYGSHVGCAAPDHYGHLGYVIHELHGPFHYDPGYGDIRNVPILKLVYFYGCSTTDTSSCLTAEVTWLAQRYGMFSWRQYERRGGSAWTLTAAPPTVPYVVPGIINEVFPCDGEML